MRVDITNVQHDPARSCGSRRRCGEVARRFVQPEPVLASSDFAVQDASVMFDEPT